MFVLAGGFRGLSMENGARTSFYLKLFEFEDGG